MTTFKIAVIGDSGAGKTAFIRRQVTGEWIGTSEPDVSELVLNMNHGSYRLILYDGKPTELVDAYILMFSVKGRPGPLSLKNYISMFNDKPRIVVGNKCDLEGNQFGATIKISVKTGYRCDVVLRKILEEVTGHHDMAFVTSNRTDDI